MKNYITDIREMTVGEKVLLGLEGVSYLLCASSLVLTGLAATYGATSSAIKFGICSATTVVNAYVFRLCRKG